MINSVLSELARASTRGEHGEWLEQVAPERGYHLVNKKSLFLDGAI
ncbi:hypothetical protein KKC_06797 [Listeria fleischmannii subsp. coloradonensis]|nr:hypothetical protein KKC_06797 [Listeria fleischmannii subsp. coloradonensis]